jgi:hypothetical protein
MPNPLINLEAQIVRRPVECSALLGVGYSSYMAMRAGKSPVPRYVQLHAELLSRLPSDMLRQIERERLSHEH